MVKEKYLRSQERNNIGKRHHQKLDLNLLSIALFSNLVEQIRRYKINSWKDKKIKKNAKNVIDKGTSLAARSS